MLLQSASCSALPSGRHLSLPRHSSAQQPFVGIPPEPDCEPRRTEATELSGEGVEYSSQRSCQPPTLIVPLLGCQASSVIIPAAVGDAADYHRSASRSKHCSKIVERPQGCSAAEDAQSACGHVATSVTDQIRRFTWYGRVSESWAVIAAVVTREMQPRLPLAGEFRSQYG
jgi:hypothetical protein